LPDLRLKKDDDRKTDINNGIPEDKFERSKVLCKGEPVEQKKQKQTYDRWDCPGSTQ
jgi:hypothetical protein